MILQVVIGQYDQFFKSILPLLLIAIDVVHPIM